MAADELPPYAVLERLDELITRSGTDRPATCLLVLADPENGECLYSSAGHLPPAILDADGRVGLFPVPVGPPLGTGFGGYEMVAGCCAPDRTLLLYTDGLVERREQDVDEWLGLGAEAEARGGAGGHGRPGPQRVCQSPPSMRLPRARSAAATVGAATYTQARTSVPSSRVTSLATRS